MPTMAASTGASFLPSASPAARPSSTQITSSPRPAPTESIASSDAPVFAPVGRFRLQNQQLGALELRTLHGRDHFTDDARENHRDSPSIVVQ